MKTLVREMTVLGSTHTVKKDDSTTDYVHPFTRVLLQFAIDVPYFDIRHIGVKALCLFVFVCLVCVIHR